MPIFEYKCSDCGKTTEFLEIDSGKKSRICSYCGGKKLIKQLSVFSAGIKEGNSKRCKGCMDNTCPHSGM